MYWTLVNGFLSVVIVATCMRKNYSIYSIIEHIFFIILLCLGQHQTASFCFCISVKVVVSLGFFIWETNGLNSDNDNDNNGANKLKDKDNLSILRYLIGNCRQPCHSMIAVGETVHHYTPSTEAGSSDHPFGIEDRLFNLNPKVHTKKLSTLQPNMFYSPCVGFAIPNFDEENMKQRLDVCGKCHDWAVSVVYVLSCHKFLSYSAVSYVRWVSWVGCALLLVFCFGDSTNPTNDYKKGLFLSDLILQLITLLDIINMVKFKLEEDKVSAYFKRSSVFHILKLVVLCIVIGLLKQIVPIQMHYYGYFIYILICAICGFIVNFWTKQFVPRDSNIRKDSDDKKNE